MNTKTKILVNRKLNIYKIDEHLYLSIMYCSISLLSIESDELDFISYGTEFHNNAAEYSIDLLPN
jgi:hypothetical protein